MRKSVLAVSFAAFFLLPFVLSLAQKSKTSLSAARIQFSEKFWDFGYVPRDMKVSHIFQIKNSGTDTLIITRVRSDCGCIHSPLSNSRIAPDQASELEVIFNPQRFRGEITKAISVTCNDTTIPVSDIAFTAQVGMENPMVELEPGGVSFDTLEPSEDLTKRVEVRNTSGRKLSISIAQAPRNFIDYRIEKLEISPEETTAIYFTTNPPLPAGAFRTSLTLDFAGSEKSRCTIPIHGVVSR